MLRRSVVTKEEWWRDWLEYLECIWKSSVQELRKEKKTYIVDTTRVTAVGGSVSSSTGVRPKAVQSECVAGSNTVEPLLDQDYKAHGGQTAGVDVP